MIVLRGFRDFRNSAPFNIEDLVFLQERVHQNRSEFTRK